MGLPVEVRAWEEEGRGTGGKEEEGKRKKGGEEISVLTGSRYSTGNLRSSAEEGSFRTDIIFSFL
jgi:hypothetical protein